MGKKHPDSWKKLCELVKKDDGLPVRESGYWAEDKLFYWNTYLQITTTAMVGNPAWPGGVCYVDLFAGPGVSRIRSTAQRIPGSPLIASHAPKPFSRILLCEIDPTIADACEERMRNGPAANRYELFRGDCNQKIDKIVSSLPSGALTLAFLDPTGLHLHFNTVQELSGHGPVDLLILFPDAVDILRNADHLYFDQEDSNLDRVLGDGSKWRELKSELGRSEPEDLRRLYSDIYKSQLKSLAGYRFFDDEVIRGPAGPLYRLVYATKSHRGLDFWKKSVRKEAGGQTRMF